MTGAEYYQDLYSRRLGDAAAVLALGARVKVDSIELLLKRNRIVPQSIIELGAGTGAVIGECQRRGLAKDFTAVDYSSDAVGHIRENYPLIKGLTADVTTLQLKGEFDLVVASHVVEHLEQPQDFLSSLSQMQFSYAVIEVPLEDLAAGKVKSVLRDRRSNLSGHVQFFSRRSFDKLVRDSGLTIVDYRLYTDVQHLDNIKFVARTNGSGKLREFQTMLVGRYLPKYFPSLMTRFYLANYAVLCKRS